MNLENYEKIKDLPNTNQGTSKLNKNDQKDKTILRDLAIQYPERLSYDKLLSGIRDDRTKMKSIISSNPSALIYMSEKLKADVEFLTDVINSSSSSNTIQNIILQNCNVMIVDGKVVTDSRAISEQYNIIDNAILTGMVADRYVNMSKTMSSVIAVEPAMILLASDELRNNRDFIRTECFKNDKIIDIIAENTDQFGTNGLIGAQEANREIGQNDCVRKLEDNLKMMTDILKAKGLSDEQIEQDPIILGIRSELSKVTTIGEMQIEKKEKAMDTYFQDMAQSGDEDIIPEDIFHRAKIQNKICEELSKRKIEEQKLKNEDEFQL